MATVRNETSAGTALAFSELEVGALFAREGVANRIFKKVNSGQGWGVEDPAADNIPDTEIVYRPIVSISFEV